MEYGTSDNDNNGEKIMEKDLRKLVNSEKFLQRLVMECPPYAIYGSESLTNLGCPNSSQRKIDDIGESAEHLTAIIKTAGQNVYSMVLKAKIQKDELLFITR